MTERGNLRFDLGFVCFALCFAVLVHITAVSPESGGTRYISSDAQQLVSFAAALDHPDAFSRDPLLSDARNFGWYESPITQTMFTQIDDATIEKILTG